MERPSNALEPSEVVGANVQHIRELRGLKQRGLAQQLGWSVTTLSNLENGKRRATVDDLLVLATVLSVAPAALLAPWDEEDHRHLLEVNVGGWHRSYLDTEGAWGWIIGAPDPSYGRFNPFFNPRDYFTTTPAEVQHGLLHDWLEAAAAASRPGSHYRGGPLEEGFRAAEVDHPDDLPPGHPAAIRRRDGVTVEAWHEGAWVDVDELPDDHPAHETVAAWWRNPDPEALAAWWADRHEQED